MIGRIQTASSFLQLKLGAFIFANYESVSVPQRINIPVVDEAKFLAVIFDNKLSFLPHIRQLKNKCTKTLNLLCVLAHTTWEADQETLLHLYRSLIRSKLDYDCVVYGSARKSYLQMLDPIQNHALRLCLGAFRTSATSIMCCSERTTMIGTETNVVCYMC